MVLVAFNGGLEGRTFGPCRNARLGSQGLSDAYSAISALNGTEHQSRLSKLGPDGDSARKRTVRSVAQQVEFAPIRRTVTGRADRE